MFNSLWYQNLIKPPFAPPNWVFSPVWAFLYLTVLISFVLYFAHPAEDKKSGYVFFAVQMLLNFVWSPAFFGMKNMVLGLFIVLLMDIFVVLTIRKFYSVSRTAGLLLIPYLIWIVFATYLNIGYIVLN